MYNFLASKSEILLFKTDIIPHVADEGLCKLDRTEISQVYIDGKFQP